MAKIFESIANMMKFSDDDDFEDDFDEIDEDEMTLEKPAVVNPKKTVPKVVNIHATQQAKVMVMAPERYDNAQEICDFLKNKQAVVINLEALSQENAQRIIDFLSGAVYALEGDIQRVANNIFIIAPQNVDIAGNMKDELKKNMLLPWMK